MRGLSTGTSAHSPPPSWGLRALPFGSPGLVAPSLKHTPIRSSTSLPRCLRPGPSPPTPQGLQPTFGPACPEGDTEAQVSRSVPQGDEPGPNAPLPVISAPAERTRLCFLSPSLSSSRGVFLGPFRRPAPLPQPPACPLHLLGPPPRRVPQQLTRPGLSWPEAKESASEGRSSRSESLDPGIFGVPSSVSPSSPLQGLPATGIGPHFAGLCIFSRF